MLLMETSVLNRFLVSQALVASVIGLESVNVASSSKKQSPIPRAPPNINLETEEGESGEEELTRSYQDADTARTDITPLPVSPQF